MYQWRWNSLVVSHFRANPDLQAKFILQTKFHTAHHHLDELVTFTRTDANILIHAYLNVSQAFIYLQCIQVLCLSVQALVWPSQAGIFDIHQLKKKLKMFSNSYLNSIKFYFLLFLPFYNWKAGSGAVNNYILRLHFFILTAFPCFGSGCAFPWRRVCNLGYDI